VYKEGIMVMHLLAFRKFCRAWAKMVWGYL